MIDLKQFHLKKHNHLPHSKYPVECRCYQELVFISQEPIFSLSVQKYRKSHCTTPGVGIVGSAFNLKFKLKHYANTATAMAAAVLAEC